MKEIGTYKGATAFELTRKEYIQKRFFTDKTHYFIISDDGLVERGNGWNIMVYNNNVVAVVNADRSYVDTDVRQHTYYKLSMMKSFITEETTMKVGDKDWDAGSVEAVVDAGSDVDRYLAAAHSVDRYLEEMRNATYS